MLFRAARVVVTRNCQAQLCASLAALQSSVEPTPGTTFCPSFLHRPSVLRPTSGDLVLSTQRCRLRCGAPPARRRNLHGLTDTVVCGAACVSCAPHVSPTRHPSPATRQDAPARLLRVSTSAPLNPSASLGLCVSVTQLTGTPQQVRPCSGS